MEWSHVKVHHVKCITKAPCSSIVKKLFFVVIRYYKNDFCNWVIFNLANKFFLERRELKLQRNNIERKESGKKIVTSQKIYLMVCVIIVTLKSENVVFCQISTKMVFEHC